MATGRCYAARVSEAESRDAVAVLTRCPQCFAWFRVRAEQLSVANGQVTCGRCEHVFNALASLIEEGATPPLPPKVEDLQVLAEVQAVVETQARATSPRFVAVTATPTIAPPRARGALPVITSTSAQRIILAEGPIAPVNDELSDAFKPPVFAREAALNDELPMVDVHAAEIDPPPAEQPADTLDIGPMSTQLDELDGHAGRVGRSTRWPALVASGRGCTHRLSDAPAFDTRSGAGGFLAVALEPGLHREVATHRRASVSIVASGDAVILLHARAIDLGVGARAIVTDLEG